MSYEIGQLFRCAKAPLQLAMSVGRSVGRVTHSFDDPHGTPYWPTWSFFLMKTPLTAGHKAYQAGTQN